ncbi:MAG: peptide chain release factor N(5)-glutamine methyltransferase [Candidatus Entotheonellia bacterium]
MSLTRARALAWGVATLRRRRIDTPRLDAEVLLAHTLGCERVALYRDAQDPLTAPVLARFQELVHRRAAHEPLAYLIQSREFWSLPLTVRAGVLIPRPETEFVVEAALHYAKPCIRQAGRCRILDVGTGSGNIAIAVASDLGQAVIVATDLSAEALAIAQANARACGVADRITFLQCDLIGALNPRKARFDLLLSNPPYIATRECASLPKTIRCYEPRMAFDGGDDGLLFYRRLIAEAAQFLHNGSAAIVEVGDRQAGAVCRLFKQSARWTCVDVIKDYAGVERVVVAQCTQGGAKLHGSDRG